MDFTISRGCFLVVLSVMRSICPIFSKLSLEVSSCPECKEEWDERALEFSCEEGQNWSYHCIIDSNGQLFETCMTKTTIEAGKEGCPWIVTDEYGIAFLSLVFSDCNSTGSHCPKNHSGYSTDELYKHPICFRNESDRFNFKGIDCERQTTVHTTAYMESTTESGVMNTTDNRKTKNDGIEGCPCTAHRCIMVVSIITIFAVIASVLFAVLWKNRVLDKNCLLARKQEGPLEEEIQLVPDMMHDHIELVKAILIDAHNVKDIYNRHMSRGHTCSHCRNMDPILFAAESCCKRSFITIIEDKKFKITDDDVRSRVIGCCLRNRWFNEAKKIINEGCACKRETDITQSITSNVALITTSDVKNILEDSNGANIIALDGPTFENEWHNIENKHFQLPTFVYTAI